ncbi:type 2 periplasmic-binding domain-containing protein [Bdellovibrio svalbardensis]|uniref:Transporter substrate-binding domain-containing protein n=1 Tax=Bdellovibrio svalbardensis TaxID=2972972 RepID=A0ABT6DHD6_9BACT|nr:transporter substrate-binding domain-containing protein [Bdellovibrio svalbardensis]MDG0816255.1 transporter substrate-binding domain-containing protein [Bdellovibrio svalbardensis]
MNLLVFFVILISSTLSSASSKKITLITMDIPPFMSPHLPDQGAAIYGLRQTFKKAGYDLEVRFEPVPRIRNVGLSDKKINGFFPSFTDENFNHKLILSKLFYKTPWVIVERKDKPIIWKEPRDLLKYKGGNVAGYVLRSQVAAIYKNNMQHLESAASDSINILKLIHKRVDFIFIDLNVFNFITTTNPEIKPLAYQLKVNPKIIALNQYGIGFKSDSLNQTLLKEFNKVVDEKEFTQWVSKYLENQTKTAPAK